MITKNASKLETKAAGLAAIYLGGGAFRVASGTDPAASYVVELPEHGAHWENWSCSCAWAANGGRGCSHVRAARQLAERITASRGRAASWQMTGQVVTA
jgi:hypothetical protein